VRVCSIITRETQQQQQQQQLVKKVGRWEKPPGREQQITIRCRPPTDCHWSIRKKRNEYLSSFISTQSSW
jgi:hypothetical protein